MLRFAAFATFAAGALLGSAPAPTLAQTPTQIMAQTTPATVSMTPESILPPTPAWSGASERLIAPAGDPWITPSERTGLTATPSYDETIAWLRRLDAASPLIRMETFGRTAQGRDLWVVVASKDRSLRPARPTVLAQAGIHAGEIDGKDAGLMLLRDIAFRGKAGLLDRADLLFVPVFNADGHERSSPYNRPNQRGPVSQGWRTTAQNLNLNRDYAKADTPEMRAMIGLIRRHRPDLYLDLHVTDGVDHQHDITYLFEAWDGRHGRSQAGSAWLDRRLRPELDAALSAHGHIPGPYIDPVDPRAPEKGITIAPSPPRFSTGYGDAIRLPTVLVETHSLKPYRQRVLGTYVLIEQALKSAAAHGPELKRAIAADLRARPDGVTLAWKPREQPVGTFRLRPISRETRLSPASGREEVRWTGRPLPAVDVPVFSAEPASATAPPRAYWVPATKPEVIERLRLHGIEMETLTAPRTVTVEQLRLPEARVAASANEGHVPVTPGPVVRETARETYPPGSVRVPVDQPLGELAVLLLEPQSEDGLFAWGFFPEILQRTEYIEAYAIAPLAERMLAADPRLRAEFQAALAADPKFAADANARLAWFYRRTPYYDVRHLLYPVGRELRPWSAGPILALVVARARNGVIGRAGGLPWRLRSDMALFKAVTMGKPILMGRKTWDSLPRRPLPGRTNIVLSREAELELPGAVVCERFDEALAIAREQARDDGAEEVCVIGGEALFALALPKARRLYLTEVEGEVQGDVVFPPFDESAWTEVRREPHPAGEGDDHPFTFRVLERR